MLVLVTAPRLIDLADDPGGGTAVAGVDPYLRCEECGTLSRDTRRDDPPNEASCKTPRPRGKGGSYGGGGCVHVMDRNGHTVDV